MVCCQAKKRAAALLVPLVLLLCLNVVCQAAAAEVRPLTPHQAAAAEVETPVHAAAAVRAAPKTPDDGTLPHPLQPAAAAAAAASATLQRVLLQAGSAVRPHIQHFPAELVPTAITPTPSSAAASAAKQQQQVVKKHKHHHHKHAKPPVTQGFLVFPEHKRLLPIDAKDICLFILSFMVLSLAAGAGIGGGVLLVPMLSLITGFGNIQTVALSNVTIFAGAVTNMMFNLPRQHPFRPGPIIDYDLLLLFGPPIVMGSIAGSYINYFVPGWVTKVLVLLVLTPMTWRMVNKARLLWVAETRRISCELPAAAAAAAGGGGGMSWAGSVAGGFPRFGSCADLMPPVVPEDSELLAGQGDHHVTHMPLMPPQTLGHIHAATQQHQINSLAIHTTAGSAAAAAGSSPTAAAAAAAAATAAAAAAATGCCNRLTIHRCPSVPADWATPHPQGGSPVSCTPTNTSPTPWPHSQAPLQPSHSLQGPPPPAASGVQQPVVRAHSAANLLCGLSGLSAGPPSLSDLLGPYFLVLDTPQVADATVQTQALSRQATLQAQLQHSSSVTRRHTLDAVSQAATGPSGGGTNQQQQQQYNPQASGHSSTTAPGRPSSAPTLPYLDTQWDFDSVGTDTDLSQQHPGTCGGSTAAAAAGGYNPLSVISPFELYQQQRYQQQQQQQQQQQHKQDRAQEKDADISHHQQQQQQLLYVKGSHQLPSSAVSKCSKLDHSGCVHSAALEGEMGDRIVRHATARVPKAHISALLLMLSVVVVTAVTASLELTCGTVEYWLVVLTPLPVMGGVWGLMRLHVLWRVGWQTHLGLTHPTDIPWSPTSTLVYPAIVITVGVMAGMLGLGGGIVLAPLLLELGVQPAVSAASSQAAMLMSSATSTVVYLVNEAVPGDYGIAMATIGFTGTLFGQIVCNYVVQRTGRSSILVFILAVLFVMASGAAVVVISNAITAIVHHPTKLTMTHAHDMCSMRGG